MCIGIPKFRWLLIHTSILLLPLPPLTACSIISYDQLAGQSRSRAAAITRQNLSQNNNHTKTLDVPPEGLAGHVSTSPTWVYLSTLVSDLKEGQFNVPSTFPPTRAR
ncbi:hypothetical protein B0T17DRAFT_362027 [Bombardia bombarda]|uniref:Uncharacterized protein n=1 Tax=Bombardia bombarda TaxID=252184 RepID=A0AA40BWC9_9PEZI|nr:hypothetical protein B0T17DRAFT_362027 [Bombardia bombarda]